MAEYFCALAAANGDVEQAIIKLKKREFTAEIRHVCGPISEIDVYGILKKIGGSIEQLVHQEQQTIEDLLCAKYAAYVDKDEMVIAPMTQVNPCPYHTY